MKKTLIAMAAVAVTGGAMAQATITGAFNLDMANTNDQRCQDYWLGDAISLSSRHEDLGGGMSVAVSTTIQTCRWS